jgi:Fur family iron response transcriptional regulator
VFASALDESAVPRSAALAARTGCPWHDVKAMLRQVGLRPTRQRMALGWLLFGKGDRHVTAELLYEEVHNAKVAVSLATIYNTLHQFTQAGLLRQVAVDGQKTYFDTKASDHHHFFIEDENALVDIPATESMLDKLPTPPPGYKIARVDVVVRLKRADEPKADD